MRTKELIKEYIKENGIKYLHTNTTKDALIDSIENNTVLSDEVNIEFATCDVTYIDGDCINCVIEDRDGDLHDIQVLSSIVYKLENEVA